MYKDERKFCIRSDKMVLISVRIVFQRSSRLISHYHQTCQLLRVKCTFLFGLTVAELVQAG